MWMAGYIYYCDNCNKLFKIGETGKKVKCPKCTSELSDLKVSDEEYASLDKAGKDGIKKKALDVPEKKVDDPRKEPVKTTVSSISPENVTAAGNKEKLKQAAARTAEQHATFNNSYLKIQIQGQILAADNFVSICKMSAIKNDGVIDSNEDKLLKKITKITEDYTKALKKLI